jgi:hypothetical protein
MAPSTSLFAYRVTKVLESIPGAPGATVTIRKLAPRHLDAASKAQQMRSIEDLRQMGGPKFLKEWGEVKRAAGGDDAPVEKPATPPKTDDQVIQDALAKDPLLAYDRLTILVKGIVSWTIEEVLPGPEDPKRGELLDELDDDVQTYVATEILRLSVPRLFETPKERKGRTKNV